MKATPPKTNDDELEDLLSEKLLLEIQGEVLQDEVNEFFEKIKNFDIELLGSEFAEKLQRLKSQ